MLAVTALVSHGGKSFCVGDYVFHGGDCILLVYPGVATVVDAFLAMNVYNGFFLLPPGEGTILDSR